MKIHEYQAKEILRRHKANVPFGVVIDKKENASKAHDEVTSKTGGSVVVVKAQIHAGGRGKGGGVKVTKTKEDAIAAVDKILGMQLITSQTGPEGKKVLKVYLEQGIDIAKEYYLSILLDRSIRKTIIMASTEGGMEIEEVAETHPEKILKIAIDPGIGLQVNQARQLAFELGLPAESHKSFQSLLAAIYEAYIKEDASLLEINPLILTKQNEIIAGDCKIDLDENALYRHADNAAFRDITEEDPLEVQASEFNLNYVKLDGNIGCMVNGAGLAMATMDIVKLAGAEPANFLDVGGGANKTTVTNGFKIILGDPNVKGIFVNIFGGIVRCDMVAEGIIEAAKAVDLKVPLVVRLQGTNSELGREVLNKSGLKITGVDDLREAASTIAKLIG
ncbi:ADP-forming succinate--CoA ligase subunit beta [Leptospira interrogans]|uniref:Succinate--CoA ligase [ADP-forming] subunit beta n=1 Tax=Leptospira interrogans serovar Hardjo str. Norma TaxID=1279460 RepID=A0A0M4NI65_LEPIR|nr:ADP-forming succinate--CoA ligase subunit beta [Leptospira interrogans]ALE38472.1 succinyl-CoA synthetase beta subunit [Leptospira interrogans serovar Hardjo str. Norma]ALN99773.1 succinyl-CoA ligase subunit beta [Leptospira interrogans serovar Hardjo-prajitno]EKO98929.1 succinate-CoA ligase, beta subunit [Leptospira interrogans str. Brem 329]MCD1165663.1 ADP-forming succinate--CoA ligase subunit beta [Leptospira interrogans]MCH1885677.1 ADP-forming succinate--CoA ligase subunit beta [Lepto